MKTILRKLPEVLRKPLYISRDMLRSFKYLGNGRLCPVCNKTRRKFLPHGPEPRIDAMCSFCMSLERHRLVWMFFKNKTDLFGKKTLGKKVLHVAPEYCFVGRLKKLLGPSYLTADLFNPDAMIKMDITNIQYPDEYFDVIYCSHVLEHVDDDIQAMREFKRVLKPDGWAVLQVPVSGNKETFEDPNVKDPEQRLRLFGQEDHVRLYGLDYPNRLVHAGFKVRETDKREILNEHEIKHMGLSYTEEKIYYCTR